MNDEVSTGQFASEAVTRRDAARRQIGTAIDLVLGNGDAVSANVLTWSATEMLRGVARARGISTFQGTLEERIRAPFLKEWRELLKGHYNFFKHADRDPERVVTDFRPEATSWALFGACIDYRTIFDAHTWPMIVYKMWFQVRHPRIAVDENRRLMKALASGLADPADKPMAQSVERAAEFLAAGRRDPRIVDALGPEWLATIERE